jgi:hypothetical protein
MKSSLAVREVHTSTDEANTGVFTIAQNSKAFQTLIDGLYSDKIRAVIRELWSNAFDAHVAAGIPEVPFDCQLPTVFEPVFRVRDYGVSLGHADTMGLYTTIFASSKEGTNQQVGKLGLGSKSPFAYEDTFSVSTWNPRTDGLRRLRMSPGKLGRPAKRDAKPVTTERNYTCFIGEDGVPRITMLLAQLSAEPRGLQVSFPTKVKDCDEFADRAERVAIGFMTKPNMIGRHISFSSVNVIMEDPGLWQLCDRDNDVFNEGQAYARQGCVVYPITADDIPGITSAQAAVLRSPFFINFPIGDLDITASRESLSYKAKTCRNILQAADIIATEVRERFSVEMQSAANYMEACERFMALQTGSLHDSLKKILTNGLTWRGRKLTAQISLERVLSHAHVKSQVSVMRWDGPRGRRRSLKWEKSSYAILNIGSMPAIYLEDTSKHNTHVQGKIHYDFDCRKAQGRAHALLWIKARKGSMAWKRVYAAMGRPAEVIDAVNLPKPPPDRAGYIKKPVKLRVMRPEDSGFYIRDVQEEDNLIYINMERGDYQKRNSMRSINAWDVRKLRDQLIKVGAVDKEAVIVAVPRTCKKKITKNLHWVYLWDVADEAIDKNFDPARAAIAQKCAELERESEFSYIQKLIEHAVKPAKMNGEMGKLLTFYKRVIARGEQHADQAVWYELACLVNSAVILPKYDIRWSPFTKKVKAHYPMLTMMGYVSDSALPTTLDYVNLIDSRA